MLEPLKLNSWLMQPTFELSKAIYDKHLPGSVGDRQVGEKQRECEHGCKQGPK